ncbi:MAG: winged helix-turn-helix domain-containing protein [Chloroflexota bacterium]|nr:winged helix-turn-helix domain-containing protein [Chloroflexota bacterium]
MSSVVLVENASKRVKSLTNSLGSVDLLCHVFDAADLFGDSDIPSDADAVIIDSTEVAETLLAEIIDRVRELKLPVILVIPKDRVANYNHSLNPDELIIYPVDAAELSLRINRAIFKVNGPQGDNLLKIGDLMIDLDRYEVTLTGRRISLTFKEFQLIALLASNPGRVYSREALLNQLWGYDYLGGTRTVDVHIRRLRSKIEESGHSYLETIWNVGYRFIVD